MKNIWIINQYITSPDIDGDGYRHYYIAKKLKEKGYDCTLITSSFSHAPYRHTKVKGLYKFVNKDIKTLVLRGNKYKKSHGKGRILSWILFSINLMILPFLSKSKASKPDVILLSSLPLLPIINIILFKKLFYPKTKLVFEIRDLWPMSAIEFGNYSEKNFFIKILAYLEKLAYRKSDLIISVIPRADLHIKEVLGHGNFNYEWITNGYKIPESNEIFDLNEVLDITIEPTNFNIGYAGTLVIANPLDTIIEVVGNHSNKKLQLYILGGGPERERIIAIAEQYDNVHVLNRIPKKYVSSFLSQMDVLFMGKGTKETKAYKFGTSQLKTFDYFFAKKPIIQALNSNENPVTYSGAGYVIEPENEEQLQEKLNYFLSLDQEKLREYGMNGYNYLLENSTYDIISNKLDNALSRL